MGDLITEAVSGRLYYVEKAQFDRFAAANLPRAERALLIADLCRLNVLYMIARAGSGHIGTSFSSMELFVWLGTEALTGPDDVLFSSKGHDAPALYALMAALGRLPSDSIHGFRQLDGLPGHPDVSTPGIAANTGSLGMGISKAKGMIFASRLDGVRRRVCVITGDGELQEGQIWESLISAANQQMGELLVVVDHNKIQSDYSVESTSSLGDLRAKFEAFGWRCEEVDGHDPAAIARALSAVDDAPERPKVVIAHTIKGKGVSFIEAAAVDSDVEMFRFHSGAPSAGDYRTAAQQIIERINARAEAAGLERPEIEWVEAAPVAPAGELARLFPAYTEALLDQAARNPKLVALDADLILDMGLVPFKARFPTRFVECGIAEQDMVSQAGGMALSGLTPVVHSFSCFLSTRPNEQIYNNATERTKIVYVGGLSGVAPAGPGHSHQSVRDISALGSIPGLVMVEPGSPAEVGPMLDWCLNVHDGPSFLRMVSVPWRAHQAPPPAELVQGRGWVVHGGARATIVTSGLVMLGEACEAAQRLGSLGVSVRVINHPWLNVVDPQWLTEAVGGSEAVLVVDNHYERFGLGDLILSAAADAGLQGPRWAKAGLIDIPPSGANPAVLARLELDADGLAGRLTNLLGDA